MPSTPILAPRPVQGVSVISSLFRPIRLLALLIPLLAMALAVPPALAQSDAADNPSGLVLPRFATTRSNPINVRVGPGTRYDIAWVYVRSGVPVEIIAEFDTWRKIRDVEGEEGWVHQSLLSGDRAAYVAPWNASAQIGLMPEKSAQGTPVALLGSRFRVGISECDGTWCRASATHHPENGRAATYSGYIAQIDLWGVYKSEVFD